MGNQCHDPSPDKAQPLYQVGFMGTVREGEMFTLLTKHETYSLTHISWSGWRSSRQNESILPAFRGCHLRTAGAPCVGEAWTHPHPAAQRAHLLSQKSKLRQQDCGELAWKLRAETVVSPFRIARWRSFSENSTAFGEQTMAYSDCFVQTPINYSTNSKETGDVCRPARHQSDE